MCLQSTVTESRQQKDITYVNKNGNLLKLGQLQHACKEKRAHHDGGNAEHTINML